jgi:hypothetical protein
MAETDLVVADSFATLVGRLVCIGCDTVSPANGNGWVPVILGGYDIGPLELHAFCPRCARRECVHT